VPPEELHRATALIGFALLNGDVCFHVADHSDDVGAYLTVNTGAQEATADEADFIFVKGNQRSPVILAAKVGSLRYPEEGATAVVDVSKISDTPIDGALALTLSGPGVPDTKTVYIQGLDAGILSDFVTQNTEFPLGMDLILTDDNDALVCVPRTAKLLWK